MMRTRFSFRVQSRWMPHFVLGLWLCITPLQAWPQSELPPYERERPNFGLQITGSLKALGDSPTLPGFDPSEGKVRALEAELEYQPPFIQALGVLGWGPSFAIYPVSNPAEITDNMGSIWSIGAQIRYQARYIARQWVVPEVSYQFRYFKYKFLDGTKGSLTASGPVFGALVLLSVIEPSAAAESYVNTGILRTYAVFELRNLSASDANLSFDDRSLFFGLRFEY